jgi:hypothetical protein
VGSWPLALFQAPEIHLTDSRSGGARRWFPFWLRWVALVAALVVGLTWSGSGIGEQVAAMLQYAALVTVSLAVTFWLWFGVINLTLAFLWFIPFRDRAKNPVLWAFNFAVTFANRHVGHLEALFVWLVIALVAVPSLEWQLPAFVAAALLGMALINRVTLLVLRRERKELTSDELYWRRRPFIYLATLLGLSVLALRAPAQASKLIPLAAAIGLGGLLPRYVRHRRSNENTQHLAGRRADRRAQVALARRFDLLLGPVAVIALLGGVVFESWWLRRQYDQDSAPSSSLAVLRDDVCGSEVGGPAGPPELSLFIVADTQLHELGGKRFPGQTELADAFVPVAVRPVELDLLSAATLWHLGNVYRGLAQAEARMGRSLGWTHLGDVADLSCASEIERIQPLFQSFGRPPVGLAAGNHDNRFTGNFFWNPYWNAACPGGVLEKTLTNRILSEIAHSNPTVITHVTDPTLARVTGRGGAVISVSPLGRVTHHGKPHGLIGVFVDTADGDAFDFGVAGLFGSFSHSQAVALRISIAELIGREKGLYVDPLFLVFAHHPLDEMASPSRKRLMGFLDELDRTGSAARDRTPRLLAVLTAHTHRAEGRVSCLGGRRLLREIVVGSTIDPPQEAALLAIGPDLDGAAALRLTTVPAVARAGKTCGTVPPAIPTGADCQDQMATLRQAPECRALFERTGERLGPDCQILERRLTLNQRLTALRKSATGFDPQEIKEGQAQRAGHLFDCLCRGGACIAPSDPLDSAQYGPVFDRIIERKRVQELACLSWAASTVQEHKTAGMQMADALRCSFEDSTIQAAKEIVASLEGESCP